MERETVLGSAHPTSPSGLEREATHKIALDAKEQGDLDRMFAAYEATVNDRAESENALLRTAALLSDKPAKVCPIEAIRDVALAAIQLSCDIAIHVRSVED